MKSYWINSDGSIRESNLLDSYEDAMIEDYATDNFGNYIDDLYFVGCQEVIWQHVHRPGADIQDPAQFDRAAKKREKRERRAKRAA